MATTESFHILIASEILELIQEYKLDLVDAVIKYKIVTFPNVEKAEKEYVEIDNFVDAIKEMLQYKNHKQYEDIKKDIVDFIKFYLLRHRSSNTRMLKWIDLKLKYISLK